MSRGVDAGDTWCVTSNKTCGGVADRSAKISFISRRSRVDKLGIGAKMVGRLVMNLGAWCP